VSVDGNVRRRRRTKPIIEDLEREVPFVPELEQGRDIVHDRQIALPRHVAQVPAPRQVVHLDHGRIGELDDEDLARIDLPQTVYWDASR